MSFVVLSNADICMGGYPGRGPPSRLGVDRREGIVGAGDRSGLVNGVSKRHAVISHSSSRTGN